MPNKISKQFLVRLIFNIATTVCFPLVAHAAPGDLDLSFGSGGKVVTSFNGFNSQIGALAIQSDGKIVAAGVSENGQNADFALARYNSDGSLDASFGTGGRLVTPIGSSNDAIYGIAIQSDGKIVAAGYSILGSDRVFTIARYNSDGSFDVGFGTGGVVTTRMGIEDVAFGVKIQPDGKIVVVGDTGNGANRDFATARYNSNGALDASFGSGGKVLTPVGSGNDYVSGVALQTDGRIVVVGTVNDGAEKDFALARYNSDGSLDASFGTGGKVITPLGNNSDVAYAIVIQPDGKIVVVGDSNSGNQIQFALAKYNINGTLDASFGTNGLVITPVNNPTGNWHSFTSAALQSNGKIVVAGRINGGGSLPDFVVARYTTNGTLDASFGAAGMVVTAIGAGVDVASSVAIQRDGKIVAGGWRGAGGIFSFALARYQGDQTIGKTRFDFDGDGRDDVFVFRPSDSNWYRLNSSNNAFFAQNFGLSTDRIVPADYDGDGRTDIAVFRNGTWYILQSSNGALRTVSFGQAGDAPIPFDYDGDQKAETAVFRAGIWYLINSNNNQFRAVQFGNSSDKPVPADYDGDGKADVAVFRDGNWYWMQSSDNQFKAVQFGISSDKPTVGDYDGDNKADQAVFRNGIWYLNRSAQGFTDVQFGVATDTPIPADYDGDGKTDISVFRDGIWYRTNSANNQFAAIQFGVATDQPIPAVFLP